MVHADFYIVEFGGVLTFRENGDTILSYNQRAWAWVEEEAEVQDVLES